MMQIQNRRNRGAATLAALFCASFSAVLVPAASQADPPRTEKGDKRPQPDARRLLGRMLRAEKERAVSGREVTVLMGGRQSEQVIKRDPKRGLRTEFTQPPGDLLIDNFKRSYFFSARGRRLIERESRLSEMREATRDVFQRIKDGGLQATVVGQDQVAGRLADIVSVSPPEGTKAPSRRFWVDRETGLRLKTEEVSPEGRVLSSSYYLTVDLSPSFGDADFAPPQVGSDVRVENHRRRTFPTIEEAQGVVDFPIRRPTFLPPGFAPRGISVLGTGDAVVLRFANGMNVVSLFQTDAKLPPKGLESPRKGPGQPGPRMLTWRDKGVVFALIGNLPEADMGRIRDSVR